MTQPIVDLRVVNLRNQFLMRVEDGSVKIVLGTAGYRLEYHRLDSDEWVTLPEISEIVSTDDIEPPPWRDPEENENDDD